MSILLVTPLPEERDILLADLTKHGFHPEESLAGRLPIHLVASLNVLVAHGGHGKTQCAIQTRHVLDHANPISLVICCGAAGGLAEAISIGDIVVATETLEHDYHRRFSSHPQPRFKGEQSVLTQLRCFKPPRESFAVHFGVVASGDEDIVDTDRAMDLHERTGALAVAWEGAGCARACEFSSTAFIEIRAVTDISNHESPGHFKAHLANAMENLTSVVLWLAEQADHLPVSRGETISQPDRRELSQHK